MFTRLLLVSLFSPGSARLLKRIYGVSPIKQNLLTDNRKPGRGKGTKKNQRAAAKRRNKRCSKRT